MQKVYVVTNNPDAELINDGAQLMMSVYADIKDAYADFFEQIADNEQTEFDYHIEESLVDTTKMYFERMRNGEKLEPHLSVTLYYKGNKHNPSFELSISEQIVK